MRTKSPIVPNHETTRLIVWFVILLFADRYADFWRVLQITERRGGGMYSLFFRLRLRGSCSKEQARIRSEFGPALSDDYECGIDEGNCMQIIWRSGMVRKGVGLK